MSKVKRMNPSEAWNYMSEHPDGVLLDVRTKIEFSFVGHPVNATHVAWKEAPAWSVNPNFVDEVRTRVPDVNTPVLLLCRSGQRSMEAALALENAGYTDLTNVEEGFEGPLDERKHRGNLGGWRFHNLPWEQS